ncbi:MAG: Tryptophan synthase beta chain [Chlamydiia bacterium]|nr:Tryptophan synthase beta chain [Chlamydiia bacterium]
MYTFKRYGDYGGGYIPESLYTPVTELIDLWKEVKKSKAFWEEYIKILTTYVGRPTPLTEAKRLSHFLGGARVFLKREDLLHTGAHKINNTIGQCLLAKLLKKTRVIAETGAGQHGLATATACAYLGLDCEIYMGAQDVKRQEPNVKKIKLLGAKVRSVNAGSSTLKEAVNEAMRDWSKNYDHTHYCIGSALGPDPYPEMVAHFHTVIGEETKEQANEIFGKNPDKIIACIGGGSNAIGIFRPFIEDEEVELIGVEAGGKSLKSGEHAARFYAKKKGVLHGFYSYLLQDDNGQIANTHSISAGLDYPAVGPEHADLFDKKRVKYVSASDEKVLYAFSMLTKLEGIIPALESAHALAYLFEERQNFKPSENIVVNLSGRGDKDLPELFMTNKELFEDVDE